MTTRVARWRLRDNPARLAILIAALVPGPVMRLVTRAGVRWWARLLPASAFLILDRIGQREQAAAVAAACERRPVRVRRRIAALASALDRPMPEVAIRLTTGPMRHGAPTHRQVLDQARLAYRSGQLSQAVEQLRAAANSGKVTRLLSKYEGELAALSALPIPHKPPVRANPVPRRILFAVTNALPFARAGYTIRTHNIARAQRAAGFDCQVVTSWGWPALQGIFGAERRADIDGVPYHRLLPGRGRLPRSTDELLARGADALTALASRLSPAVLHAVSDHRNGSVALAVRDRTGLPVVYEVRGFLEDSRLARLEDPAVEDERHRLQRLRETAVMQAADAVVTIASTMRDAIVQRGVDPATIVVAPNAVDSSLLTATVDGARFRSDHGLAETDFVVGSVSSMSTHEGFETLLDAVALLRDAGTPVRLLLVGDGPERPALEARAQRLGLQDLAVLPGRVSSTAALVAHAALDAFVVPRRDVQVCRVVTPLKPVEAMALGTPVIASDLPALAETLGRGAAGLLVPPDDPRALAKAIDEMREDPDRRAELAAAGREEVASHRTWERVVTAYVELYERLAL